MLIPSLQCDFLIPDARLTYLQSLNDSQLLQELQTEAGLEINSSQLELVGPIELRHRLHQAAVSTTPGRHDPICRAFHVVWLYIPPILLLFGTVGNCLACWVLFRSKLATISSYVYLAVLSIVDEGVLLSGLMRRWIGRLVGFSLEEQHWFTCKLLQFAGVSTSCLSVWLIVALTVERALVITMPLKAASLARPSRSRTVILVLVFVFCSIAGHFFLTVSLISVRLSGESEINDASQNRTISDSTSPITILDVEPEMQYLCKFYNLRVNQVWIWVDATLYSYLPTIIIALLNAIIIHGIYRATKRRANMVSGGRIIRPRYTTIHQHTLIQKERKQQCVSTKTSSSCCFKVLKPHPITLTNHKDCQNGLYSNKEIGLALKCSAYLGSQGGKENLPLFQLPQTSTDSSTVAYRENHIFILPSGQGANMYGRETRQLTVMLLVVSCVFLITTLPVAVIKFLVSRQDSTRPAKELADAVAEMMMYTNHSANFYLYCAMGKRFRRQLYHSLACCGGKATAISSNMSRGKGNLRAKKSNFFSQVGTGVAKDRQSSEIEDTIMVHLNCDQVCHNAWHKLHFFHQGQEKKYKNVH